MKSIAVWSIAMLLGASSMGRAEVMLLECQRISEDHPNSPTPADETIKIDTARQIVIEIDGCSDTVYSNSHNHGVNGFHTKCPPSTDPIFKSLEPTNRVQNSDEKYYVNLLDKNIEWGSEDRSGSVSSEISLKSDTLTLTKFCRSCIRTITYISTYQCKRRLAGIMPTVPKSSVVLF